jgi:hypothetical protein
MHLVFGDIYFTKTHMTDRREGRCSLIDIMRFWFASQTWFWMFRSKLVRVGFLLERTIYKSHMSASKGKDNAQIIGSISWLALKRLFWVILTLFALGSIEDYIRLNTSLFDPLSLADEKYYIEQLRLYAQLLTAIFSIYFATIGIILSTGYTRMRRDIIQLLTNEQVGNVYSQILVLTAIFCISATAFRMFGFNPGIFVYATGTLLTIISSIALFPLGQRLFNFFNLNQLASSEVLPRIARHIEGASNSKNSASLANHHSKAARLAFEQLCYIDDHMKGEKVRLNDNLPALNDDYSALLKHYLRQKHRIDHQSYWFPRKQKHKQWFFAGDMATSSAMNTGSQLKAEEEINHQWLENEIIERLASHIEIALRNEDFKLGLSLIRRFSSRISTYAEQLQFDVGMRELQRIQELIEQAFSSSDINVKDEETTLLIEISDTWAELGSSLCLETLRRMITFEKELKQFFNSDVWTEKSLQKLPAFLQVELTIIVEHINFEREVEGQRLSKPKFVQQLTAQKLLQHYTKILPEVFDFHVNMVPSFIRSLIKMNMAEGATQVILSSLHNHWKLPRWFDDISQLLERYGRYAHYPEKQYELPIIQTTEMIKRLSLTRDEAIEMLSNAEIVGHIFKQEHNNKLPDHFGQIYFELAETCIQALEQNDEKKLSKVFPMFMSLALLASDSKFVDPDLDVNDEFRLHLISAVLNDIMSVLGFSILYSAYYDNGKLTEATVNKFTSLLENFPDKQLWLKRIVSLSNLRRISLSASPRDMFRLNWKMAFEDRARSDGFLDRMGLNNGKPHKNKIVREFFRSHSDASHLFIAVEILPLLGPIDFELDYHITSLARRLEKECEEDFV